MELLASFRRAPRRLAAHLASLLGDGTAGARPVASGSWWRGCYTTDPQLKAVLQWLAASQTQSSCLLYYTESVDALAKVLRLGNFSQTNHDIYGNYCLYSWTLCAG